MIKKNGFYWQSIDWKYTGQTNSFLIQLVDEFYPTYDLYLEALSVSFQTSRPAYDSMYLVLARRNNATLLTRDKKFYQMATKLSIKTFFPPENRE